MPALSVSVPFPVFQDRDGQPLDNGYVYIGTPYLDPQTNQVQVYFDEALTIQASQPLRTINGYVSNAGTPAQLYVNGVNFSIKVLDSKANFIYAFSDGSGVSPNASGIEYVPPGTGAIATTVQSKLRETISVKDFGAVGDGVTDDLAAFNAAIASIVNNAASPPYSGGNTILVPQGTYYLSGQLSISKQIILRGVTTPDGNAWSGSILKFATGTTGIRIYDYRTSPVGTDAGGTTIENLTIRTTRNTAVQEANCHGVHADTRFTVRNCVVTYFGDCGINIVATSGGSPNGNANNWRIDNVRCAENGYDGLYVDGADTNAGVAVRLDCSSNLRHGIFDSSFLGNTYVGCHTASNGNVSYKTDNSNARNMFLGCYAESGQGAAEFVSPTSVVGGVMDIAATSTHYQFYDGTLSARDGVVGTPAITFAADLDTGFWRPSANTLKVSTGGAERGGWNSAGGFKATTDGTYWSFAQAAHDFVQSSTTTHSSIDYITSAAYTGIGKYIKTNTASGTGFNLLTLAHSTAQCFLVLGNGNVQNTNNSYGAISDIKLKQDIVDAGSQWADIKAVRFRKYRFKTDPNGALQLGVIAQELETVAPGLIEETIDRDEGGNLTGEKTKTVKYSVLTMKAIKALQEAMTRIESLEKQVVELKSFR